jgi:hypothetical protein
MFRSPTSAARFPSNGSMSESVRVSERSARLRFVEIWLRFVEIFGAGEAKRRAFPGMANVALFAPCTR